MGRGVLARLSILIVIKTMMSKYYTGINPKKIKRRIRYHEKKKEAYKLIIDTYKTSNDPFHIRAVLEAQSKVYHHELEAKAYKELLVSLGHLEHR